MSDFFTGTEKECNDLVAKLNTFYGYPNPATKTTSYGKVHKHEKRDEYYVIIKGVFSPKEGTQKTDKQTKDQLTTDEKGKIKDEDLLDSEGAFPKGNAKVTP